MKRLILILAAASTVATPVLMAANADAQPRGKANSYSDNRGKGNDSRERDDHRNNDRSWDASRYNGYYLNNRWYWGQPSASYYTRNDYRPDFRAWERGGYVPKGYPVFVVNDWQSNHLRRPPRGYHWVRTNNNDFLLEAIATGLIAEVLAHR